MPIRVAVENRDELRLIVYCYSGHIYVADVFESVGRTTKQFAPGQSYRELLIFEHDTDLSDLDPKSLTGFMQKCVELYYELKLGLRSAAAVLDESIDAKLIMPLFNALALTTGPNLHFELFTEVDAALKWLGIPAEEGLKIVARAE